MENHNDKPKQQEENPPELPPKPSNYPKIYITTTNQRTSSKTLVRFLFSLSNLIFFGGSLAGLVVLFYQKYLFPKLKIRTEILTSLRLTVCKAYDRLLESIKTLVHSHPQLYLGSRSASLAILQGNPCVEGADGEQAGASSAGGSTDGHALAGETTHLHPDATVYSPPITDEKELQGDEKEVVNAGATNPVEFNRPICERLVQIATGLRKRRSEGHGGVTRVADVEEATERTEGSTSGALRGMEGLKRSLQTIREELMADVQQHTRVQQKLLASSHPHRAFAFNQYNSHLPSSSATFINVDNDPYFIALSDLKNSIRNFKGLLLNRTKFY